MTEQELKQFIVQQAAGGSTIYGLRVADRIYGPYAANARQNIMQALTGAKVPKSKCGHNAVRLALFDRFGVTGECLAEREQDLQQKLTAEVAA